MGSRRFAVGAFLFCSTLFLPRLASANLLFFDTNLYYTSDNLTTSSAATSTKTLYDVGFGFSVGKSNQFMVGWNYSGHSFNDTSAGTTNTYVSTQMGPRFIYYFDKERKWRSSFAYNLTTTANYTAGASPTEKWTGTGMSADLGYQFRVSDSFSIGLRLSYTTTAYKESLVSGTTYSTISYTKTFMYPSVALTFEF